MNKKPFSEKTRLLDKYNTMPQRSLQRLLRETEPDMLSIALYGSDYNVLSFFSETCPNA